MNIIDENRNLTDSWAATRVAWAATRESWIASRELWAKTLQASAKNNGLFAAKREQFADSQPAVRGERRPDGIFDKPADDGSYTTEGARAVF